jgi:hypothetical protein
MIRRSFGTLAALMASAGLAAAQPYTGPAPVVQTGPGTGPAAVQGQGPATNYYGGTPYGSLPGQPVPVSPPGPPPGPDPVEPAVAGPWGGPSGPGCDDLFWFRAEYLLWWIHNSPVPTLVGTSPTDQVIASSTTGSSIAINSLFGGPANDLSFGAQSGIRLGTGVWLTDDHCIGIDASYFQLQQGKQSAFFASPGDPVIGPTFYDPVQGQQIIILASMPAIAAGSLAPGLRSAVIGVEATNRLWGAELNVRTRGAAVFFADTLDWFAGFRHLQYSEGLTIATHSEPLPGNTGASTIDIVDRIGTINQFWGPQVGFQSRAYWRQFSFDFIGKIALGGMHEVSKFNGSTTFSSPGTAPVTTPGGILAQPTNLGPVSRDVVTFIPEITATLGYQFLPNLRGTIGYNFLYIGRVARAGQQIDSVDSRNVQALAAYDPANATPRPYHFGPDSSRFWAQGLNLGLEFLY